ncbi:hypothetical protein HOV93_32800 [Planctomycetes bacterium FF15]|uniref:Uncharacterized protein n=2 Tax=Bremerella alba TaxID=980252 RepID=A0A7V9A8J1_9BACT|nr:hypothetical protein [Bremerella alba]
MVEVSGTVSPSYWDDLLLLSENSYLAQLGKRQQEMQFPDDIQKLSYTLDHRSPLHYQLQRVTVIVVDEQGTQLSSDDPLLVIVSGRTDAANTTIDYFSLNTQFYDASNTTFTIPLQAVRTGFDRRVSQRTHVWKIAVEFAEQWIKSQDDRKNQDDQQILLQQVRRLAAATGYWSTWAAAMMENQVPTTIISDILLSPSSLWELGPGPHNPYPGTNPRIA